MAQTRDWEPANTGSPAIDNPGVLPARGDPLADR